MVMLTKGSAFLRGLSLSDKVYLAPGSSRGSAAITVAVRQGHALKYLTDHSEAEIQNWAAEQPHHQKDILEQLEALEAKKKSVFLGEKREPLVMGIVNVTPDSFSDGGKFHTAQAAVDHAHMLAKAGADILDFGGESTRPGAAAVSVDEEIFRVVPVIEKCRTFAPFLSIDTRKSEVMRASLQVGANMLNDVTALEYDEQSMAVAAASAAPVCLMHSSADPKVMQDNPRYDHVLFDVLDYLKSRIDICGAAGIDKSNIIIDPGIGFGKTLDHNLTLLKGLRFFHALGCPVLLGASRKSFIGKIDPTGGAVDRIGGSLSAVLYGLAAGVEIFRVHDVAQTRQAMAVWQSIDNTALMP